MKKRPVVIVIVLIIIGILAYFLINNISITKNSEYMDYTPQEEISENQTRQTTINLYFLNPETNNLKSEGKSVNANELLKNPYKLIVDKLIEGPENSKLQKVFPENTRLIDANIQNNCVTLNFSEEFMNFKDDTQKYNIINSILDSLTQLNEVESIKILVNNETKDGLSQEYTTISENP
ncbi:MAG: GerMN domain-containing protein [Clostridia bacterium]|nr:GerMN domain-containing protein [Clostridia bacterium]